jgi:hypothetical protein
VLIERLVVEGGFLDGLDLSFSTGLNAIIGGRGTGKTSIIELLRFCLDVPNYTDSSAKSSREHALAVLQDGQVSVHCAFQGKHYTFMRTAATRAQRLEGAPLPIMFSQKDVEQLGMQPPGRLNLIDDFLNANFDVSRPDEIVSAVASLTAQMQDISREVDTLSVQLAEKSTAQASLKELAEQEATLLQSSNLAQTKQSELRSITDKASAINLATELSHRTAATIQDFSKRLSAAVTVSPILERWPTSIGTTDRLAAVRAEFQESVTALKAAIERIRHVSVSAFAIEEEIRAERVPLDQAARLLRTEIDGYQQGAGAISRQASALREKLNQLASIEALKEDRVQRLDNLQGERGGYLDQLDAHAQSTFEQRLGVVNRLNKSLAPRIRLKAIRAAQVESYAAGISNALRGSGIKYNELSSDIAARLSPRELVELVEKLDVDHLCVAADITRERAVRIITRLREVGLEGILCCQVDDDVELSLLHGSQYKAIDRLSTGQRCTVVLPIVMEHRDRVIVVDQPEDHLDNEFIAETLIHSLRNRGREGQIIFSTHNANIPVLGEADRVIHLGSDGQHGFIEHAGALDDDETVTAITNVMEGGREAFEKRASFYASHQGVT